jgi:hypothetical protein
MSGHSQWGIPQFPKWQKVDIVKRIARNIDMWQ